MSIVWMVVLLAIAFAIVVLSYVISYSWVGAKPFDHMGAGDWKFNESWASTLTASGGILATIVAAQILPSDTDAEKLTEVNFVAVHLMLSAVIVVAAALYNTLRIQKENVAQPPEGTPKAGETPKAKPPSENATVTFQYQGFVICFLIASVFILWAVLSQLLTVWHLLGAVPSFPTPVYTVFTILLGLAGVLALIYGATSIPWTLRNQAYRDEIGTGQGKQQKPRVRSSFYFM